MDFDTLFRLVGASSSEPVIFDPAGGRSLRATSSFDGAVYRWLWSVRFDTAAGQLELSLRELPRQDAAELVATVSAWSSDLRLERTTWALDVYDDRLARVDLLPGAIVEGVRSLRSLLTRVVAVPAGGPPGDGSVNALSFEESDLALAAGGQHRRTPPTPIGAGWARHIGAADGRLQVILPDGKIALELNIDGWTLGLPPLSVGAIVVGPAESVELRLHPRPDRPRTYRGEALWRAGWVALSVLLIRDAG